MSNEFPTEEEFTDYLGVSRKFILSYNHIEPLNMYAVYAKEDVSNSDDGYCFSSLKSNIPSALGDLRRKIRRRLSIRYLSNMPDKNQFRFDEVVGHIGYGGVIVDGIFIPFEDFCNEIQTYEGFLFELKIKDLSNE